VGVFLAIAGLVILSIQASRYGDVWHVVCCTIFSCTLIMQYTFSTLYHSIGIKRFKRVFRTLDHSAIFLLIAGSYTPFMLITLKGGWGWTLFIIIWFLALTGIVFQKPLMHWRWISLTLYVGMGWVVLIAIKPLWDALSSGGLLLLFLGGLSYSFGVIFYVRKQMTFHHAVWHTFVLVGSIMHYFAVLFYVVPRG
jgi:hemolysin III